MLQRDEISIPYYIRSYDIDSIQLFSAANENERVETFNSTLLLSSDTLQHEQLPDKFEQLSVEVFKIVEGLEVEILLIGTGQTQKFPSIDVMKAATGYDFSVDYMDTGAASRTFNILANENRRVAALLFLE